MLSSRSRNGNVLLSKCLTCDLIDLIEVAHCFFSLSCFYLYHSVLSYYIPQLRNCQEVLTSISPSLKTYWRWHSMTALSVYLTNAASTVLTTANKLYIASGTPTNSTHDQVIGTATGFGELTARSNATWLAGGSIGSPTGKSWFLDLTTLDAQRIAAGNWSSIIKLQAQQGGGQAGTLTADLYVRAYKYSSGVYTQIVSMLLSAQTI